jgi:hypothetical protein
MMQPWYKNYAIIPAYFISKHVVSEIRLVFDYLFFPNVSLNSAEDFV